MRIFEKTGLIFHILRWRLTWARRDLDYRPKATGSPKFITAREAATKIPDGACVGSSGMAGNARCSVFFWAIREAFEQTGHPRDLTWINVGAQGSRGRVPGTVEELGLPGLLARYIAGHLETTKAQLRLADAGMLEMHTLPQGAMALLLEAQENGQTTLRSEVGLQTFLDPRVGPGSPVTPDAADQFIRVDGDALEYTMPRVEVALFNAPYADAEGNIYFHHASCLSENEYLARAAHANQGLVMATVSAVIPKDEAAISLPAELIDYMVVHPHNEQTASVRQKRYWPMFVPGQPVDVSRAQARLKFINTVLRITPIRDEVGQAMARLGATLFARHVPKGSLINIGVGFPEEVARYVVKQGLGRDLTFTTEAGAYGGLPVPGVFFGAAIGPEKLISSTEMFHLYREKLGACVLGFLEVDEQGNVNASKRGPRMLDYVGPGGFPDIVYGAKTVIFIGSWMTGAGFRIREGQMHLERPGKPKFKQEIAEITFSAREALRLGKQVFYVTQVGAFQLTEQGLALLCLLPGIDLHRDVLAPCPARIHVPEEVPLVAEAIVTGKGFRLEWPEE
jgi:propionate CoA-transferase